jgi:hypothetical protein
MLDHVPHLAGTKLSDGNDNMHGVHAHLSTQNGLQRSTKKQ